MKVHPASHLLVLSHLLCQTPLVQSQAGLSELPGIAAWQAAIQQHALAEGRVVPKKEGEVPGMANWEAHQRAVLEEERKLEQKNKQGTEVKRKVEERVNIKTNSKSVSVEQSEKVNTKPSSTQSKSGVAGGFKDIVKASINKLLSKLSGKDTGKGSAGKQLKSKVKTLLEESRVRKIKEQPREESFLDKLIQTYSVEERENALRSVGKGDDVFELSVGNSRKKDRLRGLRQNKYRERFSFLSDYDYDLPPRRQPSQTRSFRVLSGDYLDLLSDYDDYGYEDDVFEDYLDYNERVGGFLQSGISSAARESKLLDRQLKKLLRNI